MTTPRALTLSLLALVIVARVPASDYSYLQPFDPLYEKDLNNGTGVPAVYPGPVNVTADPIPAVDVNSRDSVRQFWQAMWRDTAIPSLSGHWTGNFTSLQPGDLTVTWRKLILQRINAYRALAGVPLVTGTRANWDAYSQEAAFAMAANDIITHELSPAIAPVYWSRRAAVGCLKSGLGWDYAKGRFLPVDGQIIDWGQANFQVGHRTHLLSPVSQAVGIGNVPDPINVSTGMSAFALRTGFDDSGSEPWPATSKRDRFVAWPNRGCLPLQLLDSARWSFQNDNTGPTVSFESATAEVYRDGELVSTSVPYRGSLSITVLIDPSQETYGIHPWTTYQTYRYYISGDSPPWPGRDVRYTIRLTGLRDFFTGAPAPDYYSSTTVFDADQEDTAQPLVPIPSLLLGQKFTGAAVEVLSDIHHPNGNIYDQLLLTGEDVTFCADPGQMTRLSFTDLNDDIVQVEFAGAGRVRVVLDAFSPPARPVNYNQDVSYAKGHARIYIAGADSSTYLNVFSVGKANAVNQALFKPGVNYDGVADIQLVAIASPQHAVGGLLLGNVSFIGTSGYTGLFAPGIGAASGVIRVGDITAADRALPMLLTGSVAQVTITGGSLRQDNGWPVTIGDIAAVKFTDGTTSHGLTLARQTLQAVLHRNDRDASFLATY